MHVLERPPQFVIKQVFHYLIFGQTIREFVIKKIWLDRLEEYNEGDIN